MQGIRNFFCQIKKFQEHFRGMINPKIEREKEKRKLYASILNENAEYRGAQGHSGEYDRSERVPYIQNQNFLDT